MQEIITLLYKTFSKYKLKNPEDAHFFDFGPNEFELEGIKKPIKEIPDDIVRLMEFYGEEDGWGTQEEVKYLLPRVFEYLNNYPERLEESSLFSYFKFKLKNCIKSTSNYLDENEKSVVKMFFTQFLTNNFGTQLEIGFLIECGIEIGFTANELIQFRHPNQEIKTKQIPLLLRHFKISDQKNINAKGVYCEENQTINVVVEFMINKSSY